MMQANKAQRSSAELLGDAVHRNNPLSVDGILERLFTFAFRDLVYPQIWEDPRVDMEALDITPATRIVAIASGGCNVLSYLTARPERIYAVDLNNAHVALNRLKFAAVRNIPDYDSFYRFFGWARQSENIQTFDQLISEKLDPASRDYWNSRDMLMRRQITRFTRGFYRYGLLGRCISVAHGIARLHGRKPREMMQARTRTEQIEIFERELAPLFKAPVIRWALGHRAALYGLGIPPAQYNALLGDAGHMADVICARLRKLACDFDLNDNYFAWQAFNRAYARDGKGPYPPYLEAESYGTLQAHIDRVSIQLISITEFLALQPAASLDRYVLLDAQDWMGDQELSRLWSEITRTARPGARVIFRTAGLETILPGRVPETLLDRWSYAQNRSAALTKRDRSAIYGGFHLYERTSD